MLLNGKSGPSSCRQCERTTTFVPVPAGIFTSLAFGLCSRFCSDSDDDDEEEEEVESSFAESSSASAVISEDEADETGISSSLSEPSVEGDSDDDEVPSSSTDSASSVDDDDVSDIGAPSVPTTTAIGKVGKAHSGRALMEDAEIVEVERLPTQVHSHSFCYLRSSYASVHATLCCLDAALHGH